MITSDDGMVRSADGTAIGFERSGSGPPLVLVEAAGHHRGFSSFGRLAELLRGSFTVLLYDRRGRGSSGDTLPYAVEREVEDLAEVIDEAGGAAYVYGFSSGALLALHAAAAGLPITRLAVLEPPIGDGAAPAGPSAFTSELRHLVAAGRGDAAVEYFNTSIGVPEDMLAGLRGTPAWEAMVAVAPTLVYDGMIGDASPPEMLAGVPVPTLVIDSEGSTDDLAGMAATVARLLPDAQHRSLPGEWHGPRDEDLAEVLVDFFVGGTPGGR
jgi:pimeloyl-ACP methyl ester carboxylesterase